jgi:hypothetical protein
VIGGSDPLNPNYKQPPEKYASFVFGYSSVISLCFGNLLYAPVFCCVERELPHGLLPTTLHSSYLYLSGQVILLLRFLLTNKHLSGQVIFDFEYISYDPY